MNVERRAAIRELVIIAGGITFLPSCFSEPRNASIRLKNLDINGDQEKLLAEIGASIIPQTDTPGAKELCLHLFVLKMLDDCYEKEEQQSFVKGLALLEDHAKKRFDNSFVDCTSIQREQMLQDIESKSVFPVEVYAFYAIMKERILQGYLNSEYVMTHLLVYELIPSTTYNGYYPVNKLKQSGDV